MKKRTNNSPTFTYSEAYLLVRKLSRKLKRLAEVSIQNAILSRKNDSTFMQSGWPETREKWRVVNKALDKFQKQLTDVGITIVDPHHAVYAIKSKHPETDEIIALIYRAHEVRINNWITIKELKFDLEQQLGRSRASNYVIGGRKIPKEWKSD